MGNGGAGARDRMDYWSDKENSGILKNTNKVAQIIFRQGLAFFHQQLVSSVYFAVSDYPLCVEIHTRIVTLKTSKSNPRNFVGISNSCLRGVQWHRVRGAEARAGV